MKAPLGGFHDRTFTHGHWFMMTLSMMLTRAVVFPINALWKNKIAVLVGDFLLSKDYCWR